MRATLVGCNMLVRRHICTAAVCTQQEQYADFGQTGTNIKEWKCIQNIFLIVTIIRLAIRNKMKCYQIACSSLTHRLKIQFSSATPPSEWSDSAWVLVVVEWMGKYHKTPIVGVGLFNMSCTSTRYSWQPGILQQGQTRFLCDFESIAAMSWRTRGQRRFSSMAGMARQHAVKETNVCFLMSRLTPNIKSFESLWKKWCEI